MAERDLAEIFIFYSAELLLQYHFGTEEEVKSGNETGSSEATLEETPQNYAEKYALAPSQLDVGHPIFLWLRASNFKILSDETNHCQRGVNNMVCSIILVARDPKFRKNGKIPFYDNHFFPYCFNKFLNPNDQWSCAGYVNIAERGGWPDEDRIISVVDEKGLAVIEKCLTSRPRIENEPEPRMKEYLYNPTLLVVAIDLHYNSLCEFLLKNGVPVNELNDTLKHALSKFNYEAVELLLKHGADIKETDALSTAVENDDFDMIVLLIDHGADIHSKLLSSRRETWLHRSICGENSPEIVKLLLCRGVDVNGTDCEFMTPLLDAMEKGLIEHIYLLVKFGAHCIFEDLLKMAAKKRYNIEATRKLSFSFCRFNFDFSNFNTTRKTEAQEHINTLCSTLLLEDEDPEEVEVLHIRINSIVAHQIIKIEVAYKSEGPLIPREIYRALRLNNFKNECRKEIVKLKREIIGDCVSLFEILIQDTASNASLFRNKIIHQSLENYFAEARFLIYGSILKDKISDGIWRRRGLNEALKILKFLFEPFTDLPWFLQEKIVKKLNNQDIIILETVFTHKQLNSLVGFPNFLSLVG